MAIIDVNLEDTLLIVSVTGDLTANEVIAVINEHYPTGTVKDVIWDLTNGTMLSFSKDDLDAIAHAAKNAVSSGPRLGGRTYFVGTSADVHSLFCKYVVIAEILETSCKYQVFKTLEEARRVINWCKL